MLYRVSRSSHDKAVGPSLEAVVAEIEQVGDLEVVRSLHLLTCAEVVDLMEAHIQHSKHYIRAAVVVLKVLDTSQLAPCHAAAGEEAQNMDCWSEAVVAGRRATSSGQRVHRP